LFRRRDADAAIPAGRPSGQYGKGQARSVFFLIVEPHGLARLWATTKQKLRAWPFPY